MTRRLIGQIHLWIGLCLCMPLVVLGLSGSLLVADGWLPGNATLGEARPVGDILAATQKAAPSGYAPAFYRAPASSGEAASVRMRARDRDLVRIDVDPVSLQIVARPLQKVVASVHSLHANLLLSDRRVVGWLGVAMLALGISGLVNWWPARRRWKEAFVVRKSAGMLLHRQLHGATGIWALAVFVTVSASGVYLAFPQTVRAAVDAVLPARDLRGAAAAVKVDPRAGSAPATVDEAVALAQQQVPGGQVDFVGLPQKPDQPFRVTLLRPGQDRGAPPVTVFVDPWARRIAATHDPRDYSAGETLLAWQHALHSGEGAGPVWTLLVLLTGFLPLLFVITGLSMWSLKRRARTRSRSATAGRAAAE